MSENIIAAIDIGTTKIVAMVGEEDPNGNIYVIGHGESRADGLRRGVVVDMEKTVRSIEKAVKDAQLVSGTEIDRVTVGIAGEHIRSINSHGVVAIGRSDNEITAADVKKAVDAAGAVAIPVDREIIHVIPQSYSVDDQTGISDPVGMSGVRLEVQAHIVTASVTTAKNVYRALQRSNLQAERIVLESMALSDAHLTEDELQAGCMVIDIGGDITNISVFFDSSIQHTSVVPLGSKNVTNDIAIGLRTPLEQAESLKLGQGAALASLVDPEEMIAVAGAAGRPNKEVSRHVLASIIEPRMEEILSLAARDVKRAGLADRLTAGVVLTGGGALLPGCVDLAEQILDMPVREGRLQNIESTPDELNNNRYATAHGLLIYSFTHSLPESSSRGKIGGFFRRIENWISKQF